MKSVITAYASTGRVAGIPATKLVTLAHNVAGRHSNLNLHPPNPSQRDQPARLTSYS
jgi:hypothetical protein